MVRHLDPSYEESVKPSGVVPHFFDTIEALGGWKGLTLLFIGLVIFYLVVEYAIQRGRRRQNSKKRRD